MREKQGEKGNNNIILINTQQSKSVIKPFFQVKWALDYLNRQIINEKLKQ